VQAGDLGAARIAAGHAAALAADSDIPRRQANALYCRGLVDHDAPRLVAAADRWQDSSRPLPGAIALEAAAEEFIRTGDRRQARDAFTRAVEIYTSLGASHDVSRIEATFYAHGHPARSLGPPGERVSYGFSHPPFRLKILGKQKAALVAYEKAVDLFERAGDLTNAAIAAGDGMRYAPRGA